MINNTAKQAQLINKKLHSICEIDATYSAPIGGTKKEEEASLSLLPPTAIVFEYAPEKSFTLEFSSEKLKECTGVELFTFALHKLMEIVDEKKMDKIHIDSIVSLETKKKNLLHDYFLTLPNKTIEYIQSETVLTFYHKTLAPGVHESPIESRISLKDFEILAKLGSGGFATVYLARWKKNGRFYSLKQINKGSLSQDERLSLLREKNAMLELKSPFLVQINTSFQTEKFCYLVVDFIPGGDLLNVLHSFRRISENACKHIVAGVLLGLRTMHDKNYIYRDLKIENVLMDASGYAVLCDFGLAKKEQNIKLPNYSLCGTPEFLAPEVYLGTGYNYMADIYAVGPLIFELVTGTLPFESDDFSKLKMQVTKVKPNIPNYLTADLKNLLERLFEKDQNKRIGSVGGVSEVMRHSWFKGVDWTALENQKIKMPLVQNLEKKKFKLIPHDFNIENLENAAALDSLDDKETKSEKDNKTRIACFSYFSPLQKAKSSLNNANSQIRSAKKNIKPENSVKNAKINSGNDKSSPWIGDFDHADTDETSVSEAISCHRMSPYVLQTKLKLMHQIRMEIPESLVELSQKC